MLDTLLVALVISIDTAQVKEFPQKAEVEFKKNDLKENIIKSALNFHNSGKKDDKTWNWKIQDVVFKRIKTMFNLNSNNHGSYKNNEGSRKRTSPEKRDKLCTCFG